MLVVILLAHSRAQLSDSRKMHRYREEEGSSSMTSTKPSLSISTMPWWANAMPAIRHSKTHSLLG